MKILKIHEIFCENLRIIFVLFYDVHKEKMFTINLEDGCEAKRPVRLVIHTWSDEALKSTTVNLALPSSHGGPLETLFMIFGEALPE